MISAEGLTKRFGRTTVVDGIDLVVPRGSIYSFLGPNGAGKTTTIMMLNGLSRPTEGTISLFGERLTMDRVDLRRRIGVVPEKHPNGLFPWLTAHEYLKLFAELYQVEGSETRMTELLERVGLAESASARVATFSRGMLQKLSIVRALLHDPEILFLDEPISGLDPMGIRDIRDLILEENRAGRTIFISSHLLSEVERISDRVAIMSRGRVLAEGTTSMVMAMVTKHRDVVMELPMVPSDLERRLQQIEFVQAVTRQANTITVSVPSHGDYREQLSQFLAHQGLVPLSFHAKDLSLEDTFVEITRENVHELAQTGQGGRHE